MPQYNWKYRVYTNRRNTSECFDEVVQSSAKVYITRDMYYPHTSQNTPFHNVRMMRYRPPKELIKFISSLRRRVTGTQHVFDTLKQVIFKNWIPGKIHLIGASSGYDSRLIAKAVQELTKEHGRDWLGETHFVECAGEAEGFKAVMKKLGFQKNAIIWVPEFTFEYFENLHKRFNGLCAYPMNQWYDFYTKNFDLNEVQYISGYGGNVADAMSPYSKFMQPIKKRMTMSRKLLYYFQEQYFYQLSAFKQPKYSLHPFWDYEYIRAVSGFRPRHRRIAEYLAYYMVPECREIARMGILREVTRNGHRKVAPEEMVKLDEWYRSTRYGRRNPVQPRSKIEYNKWWLQYCIASYLDEKNSINIS